MWLILSQLFRMEPYGVSMFKLNLHVVPAVAFIFHASGSAALAQAGSASLTNSNYLTTANTATLNPTQVTLEAWIRPDGNGYGQPDLAGACIIGKPREGSSGSWLDSWNLIWSPSSRRVSFTVTHQFGAIGTGVAANTIIPIGTTAHVAGTFDGSTLKIYINGVLENSVPAARPEIYYGPTEPVLIGACNFSFGYTRRFQGLIDDVRIWDVARTNAQISCDAGCLPDGPQQHLLARWKFDDVLAVDTSGNARAASFVFGSEFGVPIANPAPLLATPANQSLCPGGTATYSVTSSDNSQCDYHWQIDNATPDAFADLTDGPVFLNGIFLGNASGTHSPQLTIANAQAAGSSEPVSLRCIVSNSCSTTASIPAALTVCPADFSCDGTIDFFDYLDFVAAFSANAPAADFNHDSIVDFFDYLDFVLAFSLGC